MTESFFKFPSTPHLATLSDVDVRCDKVMSEVERDQFLQHFLVVEEKVDGANLGISFDSKGNIQVQNRGQYICLPGAGQWKKLGEWLAPKTEQLFEHLADRYILFGEWCYAQHSVSYGGLPDWFLAFDIYDKQEGKFVSTNRRNCFFADLGVSQVPFIASGHFGYSEVQDLLLKSKLSDEPAEGIYLRHDQGDWLVQRAKLVRPSFIQTIEQHWSRSGIKPNRLKQGL